MKATRLPDIPAREPYQAPEGYFDDLPLRMQTRLAHLQQAPPTSWLQRLTSWRLQAVYSMVFVLFACLVWFTNPHSNRPERMISSISEEALEEYLVNYELVYLELQEAGNPQAELLLDHMNENIYYYELDTSVEELTEDELNP
jgi:hypothetical protein